MEYRSFCPSCPCPASLPARSHPRCAGRTSAIPKGSLSSNPKDESRCQRGRSDYSSQLTMCTGFSMLRCNLYSFLTYSSPSNRISLGSFVRWARRIRRYRGIGGRSASGAGLSGLAAPADVGMAISHLQVERMAEARPFASIKGVAHSYLCTEHEMRLSDAQSEGSDGHYQCLCTE